MAVTVTALDLFSYSSVSECFNSITALVLSLFKNNIFYSLLGYSYILEHPLRALVPANTYNSL